MKQGLLDSFRNIAWGKVLGAAPAVVEGARGLWQRMSGKAAESAAVAALPAGLGPEQLAAIDVRVGPLRDRLAALEQESRASFDVVRSITEQHAQVVQAVDVLLARTQLLLRISVALGAGFVVLAALLAVRW